MVMAMARALMQEGAPEGQRGRVMAFFTLTLYGGGAPWGRFYRAIIWWRASGRAWR